MSKTIRRLAATVALAGALTVGTASMAAADPPPIPPGQNPVCDVLKAIPFADLFAPLLGCPGKGIL